MAQLIKLRFKRLIKTAKTSDKNKTKPITKEWWANSQTKSIKKECLQNHPNNKIPQEIRQEQ